MLSCSLASQRLCSPLTSLVSHFHQFWSLRSSYSAHQYICKLNFKNILSSNFVFPWEALVATLWNKKSLSADIVWTEPCAALYDNLVAFEPRFYVLRHSIVLEMPSAVRKWICTTCCSRSQELQGHVCPVVIAISHIPCFCTHLLTGC